MRTATTNLRFDLPDKVLEFNLDPVEFNFSNPQLKDERKSILKTFS